MPAFAVHVTVPTASVTALPLTCTGGVSVVLVTAAVQPGIGVVRTEVIGWSVGSATSSFTVPAVSDSSGTRKVTTV